MNGFTDFEKLVAKIIVEGHKQCLSEAQSLDKAKLLLTPARKLEIASTALLDVARLLEETAIKDIVPAGVPLTSWDVKRSIALWIEKIVEDNKGQ